MGYRTKLISAMNGIEPFEPQKNDSIATYKTISSGNYDPPAYIVAIIFLYILKFKNFGRSEKVWWHTYFRYKNIVFMIRDYKFGSWSLESRNNLDIAIKLVPEIIGKISAASRHADKNLSTVLKPLIDKGHFFINNGYNNLLSAYEFFLKETNMALEELDTFNMKEYSEKQDIRKIEENMNKRLHIKRIISYRIIPLINTFFSLLEFILDVFYAFQQPPLSFFKFRNLSWKDRFKTTIQLKSSKDFSKVYEQLVKIKSKYRNPLTHGLTNESSLLIHLPFAGLVPISYEHLSKTVHYGLIQISPETVKEIIATFTEFLELMEKKEPYCYYVLYIKYGFPIPISKNSVEQIIKKMIDYESFEQYLQERSEYEDAIINRDI